MNKLLVPWHVIVVVTGKSEIKEFHRKGDIYQTARLSHNYQELVLAGAGDGRTDRQTDRQTDNVPSRVPTQQWSPG